MRHCPGLLWLQALAEVSAVSPCVFLSFNTYKNINTDLSAPFNLANAGDTCDSKVKGDRKEQREDANFMTHFAKIRPILLHEFHLLLWARSACSPA